MYDIPVEAKEGVYVYKRTPQKNIELRFLPPTRKVFDRAPVLVAIPGGGWRVEKKDDFLGMLTGATATLRENGWAVAGIDYRVVPDGMKLEGLVSDCVDAGRWLAHFSDVLGLDKQRFAVTGHSAGGHLALMFALAPHASFTFETPFDPVADDFRVIGAAPMSPATILYNTLSGDRTAKDFHSIYENDTDDMATRHRMSPIDYVTPLMVPTLLMYGSHDPCLNPNHSILFYEKALELGAPVTVKCSWLGSHCFEPYAENVVSSPDLAGMQPVLSDFLLSL